MKRGIVTLQEAERYKKTYQIPREKLEQALAKAVGKLEKQIEKYGDTFLFTISEGLKYRANEGGNTHWVCGMQTGSYLLAYELTGNEVFLETARTQIKSFRTRMDNHIGVNDHDVGFSFTPSCVAAYKLFGDREAYQTALDAAEYFYNKSYSQKGGFILRVADRASEEWACRTMMDTMMNIPLLHWAGKETGEQKYIDAAVSQTQFTANYLIRENGSSFHHYQFDVVTHEPVRGVTFQGYSDDSTWSRGHAWGILGFPIAYSYTGDKSLFDLERDVVYYWLNHLPEDLVPLWDLDFTKKGEQPQDSLAGVIAVCGMMEMCKYLPEEAPEKLIYQSAAAQLMEALIDHCACDIGKEYDGLLCHMSAHVPAKLGVDECAVCADYFYMEALMRFLNPEWNRYW